MKTLQIRAEESVMLQILSSINSLNKAGSQIDILGYESSKLDSDLDGFLQDNQIIKNVNQSLEQIEKDKTYSHAESWKESPTKLK